MPMIRTARSRSGLYLRRRIVAAVAAVVVLVLLLAAADAVACWGRVHPGISIAGTDFGGLKRGRAVERLATLVEATQKQSITIRAGGQQWPIQPSALGARVDVEASVADAMALGRNQGFVRNTLARFGLYFSKRDVNLRGAVNGGSMDSLIADMAGRLDHPPVNANLVFDGSSVRVKEGESGMVVDRTALRHALTARLMSLQATPVEVSMVEAQPAVRAADAAQAREEAQVMISAPVVLQAGDTTWKLTGSEIQEAIECVVEGEGGEARLVPVISPSKAKVLPDVADEVNVEVANATWDTDGQNAALLEAVTGIEVDATQTALALTVAAKASIDRVAEVVVREVEPERTTQEALEMGITAAVGKFTTEFEGSKNRVANIQRAAQLVNDTLLAPGEEFSFNKVVGERTEQRGFHQATVIAADGTLQDDLGGGICQVATTLFNAAFLGGLEITERRNHSLYFDSYPMGRDATVSWDGPDFRFVNDTEHWLLIRSAATNKKLLFVLYGAPDGRVVDYTTSDWYELEPQGTETESTSELPVGQTRIRDYGQNGRSCTVTRVVKAASGAVLHEDVFESRYPMYPKIIQEGTQTS